MLIALSNEIVSENPIAELLIIVPASWGISSSLPVLWCVDLPIKELSLNSKRKPLLPKVNPVVSIGIHCPVLLLVSPKLSGPNCCPSIKLTSARYPSILSLVLSVS